MVHPLTTAIGRFDSGRHLSGDTLTIDFLAARTPPGSTYKLSHLPSSWAGSLVGDQRDASGLLYRRNRYYDANTGQFTQPDPIGLAGGSGADRGV